MPTSGLPGLVAQGFSGGGHLVEKTLIVHGWYADGRFVASEPLPDQEGRAELLITPVSRAAAASIATAFGRASKLRTSEEILAQVRAARDEWGDR